MRELLAFTSPLRDAVVALGDWNCRQSEGAVAEVVSRGRLRQLDDVQLDAGKGGTGPSERVIDYGLYAGDCYPLGRWQVEGVVPRERQGHDLVYYALPGAGR
eukprot:2657971-Alexandrium_andersonii.AAC.1